MSRTCIANSGIGIRYPVNVPRSQKQSTTNIIGIIGNGSEGTPFNTFQCKNSCASFASIQSVTRQIGIIKCGRSHVPVAVIAHTFADVSLRIQPHGDTGRDQLDARVRGEQLGDTFGRGHDVHEDDVLLFGAGVEQFLHGHGRGASLARETSQFQCRASISMRGASPSRAWGRAGARCGGGCRAGAWPCRTRAVRCPRCAG